MTIRVLIADDHTVVREGLSMFLTLDQEFEVVGRAANGAEALRLARELAPDVVLMDLLMPVMDGIEATAAIRAELPGTEVIALTSVLENGQVGLAIRAGAIGYLLKDTQVDELRRAIQKAAAGQVQLSPEVAARLVDEVRAPQRSQQAPPQPAEQLTEREKEVLSLLARGLSNREISRELIISERTAQTHVSNILGKLGLTSRMQAALHAVQTGLVSLTASS